MQINCQLHQNCQQIIGQDDRPSIAKHQLLHIECDFLLDRQGYSMQSYMQWVQYSFLYTLRSSEGADAQLWNEVRSTCKHTHTCKHTQSQAPDTQAPTHTYHRGIQCTCTYHKGIQCTCTYHRGIQCAYTYHRGIQCAPHVDSCFRKRLPSTPEHPKSPMLRQPHSSSVVG